MDESLCIGCCSCEMIAPEVFTINKNTHTTITGPNGSGKSTILGLLSGVFYPTSGSVSTFSDSYSYIGATPLIFTSTVLFIAP